MRGIAVARARAGMLALLLAGPLACCGGDGSGADPGSRYPLAADQGVAPRALASASDTLAANPYTRSLLLERHGVLVMEDYFNGASATAAYDVRSVTKTVLSILTGIAIDRGLVRRVDETIGDYLGPVVSSLPPDKAGITIRQLLTMTSGIPWHELGTEEQDYFPFVSSPDPLLWILTRPLEHPPGQVWNYNTGACHVLSAILSEATGASAREFAQAQLFGPLGEEVGPWLTDNRGYCFGGHGVALRGRTMIRLGRLFLDGGSWKGRTIVSERWVRESTARSQDTGEAIPWGSGYGYLWWIGRDARTGLSFQFAVGYGGQFIFVVPERDTTIAAATEWGVAAADVNFMLVLRTIVDTLLPSLG